MSLEKAVIEIDEKDRGPKLPARITVQFNPTEYSLSKGAQIAEINIPGIDSPILQFVRGQNEKLTLELFFDTTENGMGEQPVKDVRDLTQPVYQLVKIQGNTHAAPRIRFVWGKGLSFRAIVESVQQKFTVFNPAGIPLRASLAVTFREYKTLEEQLAELNLQSDTHSKERAVRLRDTLSRIAFDEYGDGAEWRRIAEANPALAADPRRLAPGTRLMIPAAGVFAKSTGKT
jgi:Contractile injection system tube protein/LysM domain